MTLALTPAGFVIEDAGRRIRLGPAHPAALLRSGSEIRPWQPSLRIEGDHLIGSSADCGAELDLSVVQQGETEIELCAQIRNRGSTPLAIERLILFQTEIFSLGGDRDWRMYRNGYQSWGGTYSMGPQDEDRDLPLRFLRVGVTDARHPSPTAPGHIRSDAITALVGSDSGATLAIGFTTLAAAFGFIEVEPRGDVSRLSCWADLDGIALAAGEATAEIRVQIAWEQGTPRAPWRTLRRVASRAGLAMAARAIGDPHPGGWCSWYYYFNKVTEADMLTNLAVLAEDGRDGPVFGCRYMMVDDGHQSAIGDWLTTDPVRFPSGMAALAERIRAAGFAAGIWWAPFLVAPDSTIARTHPDWLVKSESGRPILGCLNPMWSLTKTMRVLDTTHPEVLQHLESTARVIGSQWGCEIQKLDFLYAAALPGQRYDRGATRAASLRRGLEAIRAGAGERGFLLGCGSPLGPAVGVVDAMRIGADVAPFWTNLLARTLLRNRHGLATRHAVMNTLTRAVFDGVWWLNDPDCLMVRDTETKLNDDEVKVLVTVFGMTNGMVVLSDRLDRLSPERRALVAKARGFSGGEVEIADLFERTLPELIVSRHSDRIEIGVLNLADERRSRRVDLGRLGLTAPPASARELWSGEEIHLTGQVVHFPDMAPHSVRVLQLRTS